MDLDDNLIWMDLESKKSFKDKNITISLNNIKDIYDTKGNLMHNHKTVFQIKRMIPYPETTRKIVKVSANFCEEKIQKIKKKFLANERTRLID